MSEYYIRTAGPDRYTVTKFEGSDQPAQQYEVELVARGGKWLQADCTCPAFSHGKRRPCKHFAMVLEFIENDCATPFSIIR